MNGYLLDTNIALFATGSPERLSEAVRKAVLAGPGHLSVISYWEVAIKSMKGQLDVGDPRQWWVEILDALAARPLVFGSKHVDAITQLPAIHHDPFDRALIAQAISEGLTLLTTDPVFDSYATPSLRVVR